MPSPHARPLKNDTMIFRVIYGALALLYVSVYLRVSFPSKHFSLPAEDFICGLAD